MKRLLRTGTWNHRIARSLLPRQTLYALLSRCSSAPPLARPHRNRPYPLPRYLHRNRRLRSASSSTTSSTSLLLLQSCSSACVNRSPGTPHDRSVASVLMRPGCRGRKTDWPSTPRRTPRSVTYAEYCSSAACASSSPNPSPAPARRCRPSAALAIRRPRGMRLPRRARISRHYAAARA